MNNYTDEELTDEELEQGPCTKCAEYHNLTPCRLVARKAYRVRGDEMVTDIAIFSKVEVESTYGTVTPDNADDMVQRLTGWHQSYSGPGRGFSSEPSIRVAGRNIIVSQIHGQDI